MAEGLLGRQGAAAARLSGRHPSEFGEQRGSGLRRSATRRSAALRGRRGA